MNHGRTALHRAVLDKQLGMVEFLLERGAEIDARALNGRTPLLMAAHLGCGEILERLIAAGADIKAENKSGHNALHEAKQGSHSEIEERLRQLGLTE